MLLSRILQTEINKYDFILIQFLGVRRAHHYCAERVRQIIDNAKQVLERKDTTEMVETIKSMRRMRDE